MAGLTKDEMDKLNRTGPYSRDAALKMIDGIGMNHEEFMRVRNHGVLFDCMKAPEHSVCRFCCKPLSGKSCAIVVEKSGEKLVIGDTVCEQCFTQAPWEERERSLDAIDKLKPTERLGRMLSKRKDKMTNPEVKQQNCNPTEHQFQVITLRDECVLSSDKKTTTKHVTHWMQFCTRCGLTLSDSYDDHYKTLEMIKEGDDESI